MRKFGLLFALVLIFSLVLTACGGGGGASSNSIKAEMSDFAFKPNAWTVKAGEEISLELTNTGTVEHDWSLMIQPAEAPFDAADEPNVVSKFDLATGQSTTVTFTAPTEPGEYQVICTVPGHMEAGMVGTLTVE